MYDPPMAAGTYHVYWGVQLGMKASDIGPVLNHIQRRRVEKPIKRVSKMGGWIEMLAVAVSWQLH